jgi:hypothetical protein
MVVLISKLGLSWRTWLTILPLLRQLELTILTLLRQLEHPSLLLTFQIFLPVSLQLPGLKSVGSLQLRSLSMVDAEVAKPELICLILPVMCDVLKKTKQVICVRLKQLGGQKTQFWKISRKKSKKLSL